VLQGAWEPEQTFFRKKDGYDVLALDFWSDQYDSRIQFIGGGPPHDEIVIVDGSLADRRLTALYRRGDRLVACRALNQPRALIKYRKLLAGGESWNAALSGPAAS
jgi:hypothetical protein